MSYIGSYLRPTADTGMPGIIDLQQYIQQGFDRGRAQGQNQQLAQLSQAAYNDTGADQQQDVSKAIGINPQAGYTLAKLTGAQSAADQQKTTLAQLGKAASGIVAAKQRGDDTTAEGLYQAVRPTLALFAAQHGAPPPPANVEGSDMGALYKLATMYGSGIPAPDKGVVIAAGGELVNPTTGAKMAAVPNRGQIVGGYYFDPNTGTASPIPIKGAQNGVGVDSPVQGTGTSAAPQAQAPQTAPESSDAVMGRIAAQATQLVNSGQMTTQQADQWIAQQARGAGVQFTPDSVPQMPAQTPAGGPSTLAQAIGAGKSSKRQAPSGYEWKADGTLEPIPGGPADKGSDFQGAGSVAPFGDASLSGHQYIQSIPQGNQEIVKGLLNGTVALPTGTALKNPLWQSALASVKHADPAWNQAAYKQYADTRKYFTIGQGGQLINNINTASQHLDKLREDIAALHNGNFTPLNAVENAISKGTGGQSVTNFTADLTPVASELAAVYKGKGVPSDQEIAHFRESLTPNMSYGQQMNVIRGWIDLLAGKLNATREQYRGSMSKLSDPLSVINPHAAEALERITSLANEVSTTGKHAMPAADTTPIYAPGQQVPQAAAQPSSVDSLLSKYGIQ